MTRMIGTKLSGAVRTCLVLILSLSLAMGQTPIAAAAATAKEEVIQNAALQQADQQSQPSFEITEDSVTIDGHLLFKENFEIALVRMRRSGTQQNSSAQRDLSLLSMPETGAIYKFDASSESAIASLGVGVYGVFARLAFKFALMSHVGEMWVCSVEGVLLRIYCDNLGLIINGYSIDHCWLTDMIMHSMENHVADGTADDALSERVRKEQEVEQELRDRSRPGRKTKGHSQQREVDGNYEDAKDWFDKLNPDNVREVESPYGKMRIGELSDGRTIIVRPRSKGDGNGKKNGPPTIEIQRPDSKTKIKYRFIGK